MLLPHIILVQMNDMIIISYSWDNLWDDEPSPATSTVPELPELEMHLSEEDIKFIQDENEFSAMIDEIVKVSCSPDCHIRSVIFSIFSTVL